MAGVRSTDQIVNLSWKNKCIKLLEQVEERKSSDVKEKTRNLLKEKKELGDKLKLIEEETERASKLLKEIGNDSADKPINGSLLKLYSLITKLSFDIETPANEPKGYVAGNSLETFQFDTTKHSREFIIDNLWSLIEAQLKPNREKV